jgi:hypothetical protein
MRISQEAPANELSSVDTLVLNIEYRALRLDELMQLKPMHATEPMPSVSEPEIEQVPLAPIAAHAEEIAVDRSNACCVCKILHSKSYRPPWIDLDYIPRTVPHHFKVPTFQALRKMGGYPGKIARRPQMQESLTFSWPWLTIGKVFTGSVLDFKHPTRCGTGVLVGPNLMLTASHLAPWNFTDRGWIQFIPGFRDGIADPRFGSSFVERYRRVRTRRSPFGYDYVICKLVKPLGQNVGWMGTQWWGNEDKYYEGTWFLNGFPTTFMNGQRLAVEFPLDIDAIDNSDPGLELETNFFVTDGWSGGPLWGWIAGEPRVIGIVSGWEWDGLYPIRSVMTGGRCLVELTQHGFINWQ